MRFLAGALLVLVVQPAFAEPRCGDRDFLATRRVVRNTLRCGEDAVRWGAPTCRRSARVCHAALADRLHELVVAGAPHAAALRADGRAARCQTKAIRAAAKYAARRIRERASGERRASWASRMVERIERGCAGAVVGPELPVFGGACASLLRPGEAVPATALAHCLRASVERAVDDAAPDPLAPNVVLVLTDDQRPETLGAMPTVDRLAEQGVRFTDAFATTSLCTPSRASIFSGQYAHHHGSTTNENVFDDRDTLGPWMSDAGYATGYFGKYRNDVVAGRHVPPGWDDWNAFGRETDADVACPGPDQCYANYVVNENGALTSYADAEEQYSTDVIAARLLAFVGARQTTPFFAVFAPYAVHTPSIPAPRHFGSIGNLPLWRPPSFDAGDLKTKPDWVAFARARFGPAQAAANDRRIVQEVEALQSVDEALADLLAELERSGLRDNTIVIFTSDQGTHWGEHGWTTKMTAYEESIRIPLVVSHPARTPVATERSELVLTIDLAPTIADAAGAATAPVDGESLLPLLDGPAPWRSDFLVENFVAFIVVPNAAVRTARWKYIASDATSGVVEELYDLAVDPYELHNLAFDPARQDVRGALATRLAELRGAPALPLRLTSQRAAPLRRRS